jgi:hypothetical protein
MMIAHPVVRGVAVFHRTARSIPFENATVRIGAPAWRSIGLAGVQSFAFHSVCAQWRNPALHAHLPE